MNTLYEEFVIDDTIETDEFVVPFNNNIPINQYEDVTGITEEEEEDLKLNNNLIWLDIESNLLYAGNTTAFNRFYNLNSNVVESNDVDKNIAYNDRTSSEMLESLLRWHGKNGTIISTNGKTGYTLDLSTICKHRKEGHPCPYCYVEAARSNISKLITIMFEQGWTEEDIFGMETMGKDAKFTKDLKIGDTTYETGKKFKLPFGYNNAKGVYGGVEQNDIINYGGEIRRMTQGKIDKINSLYGGLRMYSFSDYTDTDEEDKQLQQIFDDADGLYIDDKDKRAKRKLNIKVITKQKEFIEKWSNRTLITNLSVDNLANEYGFFSNSMDMETAVKYKNDYPQVVIRVVAFNPEEVIEYARNPDVDVVTPYHAANPVEWDYFYTNLHKQNPDTPEKVEAFFDTLQDMSKASRTKMLNKLTKEEKKKLCCGVDDPDYFSSCATCDVNCGMAKDITPEAKIDAKIKKVYDRDIIIVNLDKKQKIGTLTQKDENLRQKKIDEIKEKVKDIDFELVGTMLKDATLELRQSKKKGHKAKRIEMLKNKVKRIKSLLKYKTNSDIDEIAMECYYRGEII